MEFLYFLTDAAGDIPVGPEEGRRSFLVAPEKRHPFLTLGTYLQAITDLVSRHDFAAIRTLLPNAAAPDKIIIRSEKHGALYHIASLELFSPAAPPLKLALTTAITPASRAVLSREYEILRHLKKGGAGPWFPEIHGLHEESCEKDGQSETMLLMIGEWLAGFHEWHVATKDSQKDQKIKLWDQENGHRELADHEAAELIRQATFILATCYDQRTFQQIYPWHHAAGDFVARATDQGLAVRLITVRNYTSLLEIDPDDPQGPLMAMLSFFLHTTIRMRLDRRHGVAEPVWLADFVVPATVRGFFQALSASPRATQEHFGGVDLLRELLKGFSAEELTQVALPFLEMYSREDEDDFKLIRERLADHCASLHRVLADPNLPG